MHQFPSIADIVIDDHWFGTQGLWKKRPIIVRGRSNLSHLAGHPDFPKRLTISWEYGDDDASGMPDSNANESMVEFENRLLDSLEHEKVCICVAVITYAGSREWIFYSSDLEKSARLINNAFADKPRRPLRLQAVTDPEWAGYSGILTNFAGETKDLN